MSFATTITSDARGVRVVVSRFQSTAPDVSINLRRLFKLAAGAYLTERHADASFNLYGPDCSPFCLVNSEQLLTADKLKFTHQPPKMDPIKLDENPAGVPAESPRP